MTEKETLQISRRDYLKLKLAALAGLVLASAGIGKVVATEVALSKEVKDQEIEELRRYFKEKSQRIESEVHEQLEELPEEFDLNLGGFQAEIDLSSNGNSKTIEGANFTLQFSSLQDTIQSGLIRLPTHTSFMMDTNGNISDSEGNILSDGTLYEVRDRTETSNFRFVPFEPTDQRSEKVHNIRLERTNISISIDSTIRNPIKAKKIWFRFFSEPVRKDGWEARDDYRKKGIVVYFRGIDQFRWTDEANINHLKQQGYAILEIDYGEGEKVELGEDAHNRTLDILKGVKALDYTEFEDAFVVLAMLREIGLVDKAIPIHSMGFSYGGVQSINFALIAESAGYTVEKVFSYAGLHDLMGIGSSSAGLLRAELAHTRAETFWPAAARDKLLMLSPARFLSRIGIVFKRLTLIAGSIDEYVPTEHTINLARSIRRWRRKLFIINELPHNPNLEDLTEIQRVLNAKQDSEYMTQGELEELNRRIKEFQPSNPVGSLSVLMLKLGGFLE